MAIVSVEMKDNSREVLEALAIQIQVGMQEVGNQAERYAKANCPVDSGRLRNSITWATTGEQGPANTSGGEAAQAKDYRKKAKPELGTVYIGTNVEYAPYVEYRSLKHLTGRAHFLRDAATDHEEHYKEILRAALEAAQ